MNHSIPSSRKHGFTLIELLVVIAIIAILMGLVAGGVNRAVTTVKKNQAATEAKAIAGAVELFYQDYGYLPVPKGAQGYKPGPGGGDFGTEQVQPFTEDESKEIIRTLMAIPSGYNSGHQLNTREKVYLELDTPTSDGTFEDPWGTQYFIKLDRDFNGKVEFMSQPDQYNTRVVVASAGPDRELFGGNAGRDNLANVTIETN